MKKYYRVYIDGFPTEHAFADREDAIAFCDYLGEGCNYEIKKETV